MTESLNTTTTDYAEGGAIKNSPVDYFSERARWRQVYENSVLQFAFTPEGYVEKSGTTFDYVYQYKDHLGNIRLSYTDSDNNGSVATSEIIEENNYYPFGLKHKGYNSATNGRDHKYGFNGKEEQDEMIGNSQLNWLDFGARNYEASLGRFFWN